MSTIGERLQKALLAGEAINVPAYAKANHMTVEGVRHAIRQFGDKVKSSGVRGKNGQTTKVWVVAKREELAAWRSGSGNNGARHSLDFTGLMQAFGMRPVDIYLPTFRHELQGSWQ